MQKRGRKFQKKRKEFLKKRGRKHWKKEEGKSGKKEVQISVKNRKETLEKRGRKLCKKRGRKLQKNEGNSVKKRKPWKNEKGSIHLLILIPQNDDMIVDMIQNVDMILTEFFLKFFSSVDSFFDTGCGWISQMELLYALQSSLLFLSWMALSLTGL